MADDTRTFMWTIGLQDKFTKPMKSIQTQWNKTTTAGVRRSKQMKRGVTELSKGFKKFTQNLKDSVTQMKSFTKVAVAALSIIGVGALAVGLLGAFKKLLMLGMQLEEQTLKLVSVTDAESSSMGFLAAKAHALSAALGQSYEQSIQMLKAIQDIRPMTRGATEDFLTFTEAVVDYATATDSSVESVAALLGDVDLLTDETHNLRRLGDSMKYWADQTKLTNAEVQSIVQSMKSLVRMLPKGRRVGALGELTGLSGIFADVMGDPAELQRIFSTLSDVLVQSPIHGFVQQFLPGGRAALQEAMKAGDYVPVFEALIKASKQLRVEAGGITGLSALRQQIEQTTGLSAEVVAAFSELQPGGIRDLIQEAAASDALRKANDKRRNSMMTNWNKLREGFLNLMAKLSGPLLDFVNKIGDPLLEFLKEVFIAAESLFALLSEEREPGVTFFQQLKKGVKEFWKEIGGPEYMDALWESIKAWIKSHKIGEWIGENILYPAFSTVFSERVAKRILRKPTVTPTFETAEQELTEKQLERAFKEVTTGGIDYKELLAVQTQMMSNFDRTSVILNKAFGSGGAFAPDGKYFGKTPKELEELAAGKGLIPGLGAIDKAHEWALLSDIAQYALMNIDEQPGG